MKQGIFTYKLHFIDLTFISVSQHILQQRYSVYSFFNLINTDIFFVDFITFNKENKL